MGSRWPLIHGIKCAPEKTEGKSRNLEALTLECVPFPLFRITRSRNSSCDRRTISFLLVNNTTYERVLSVALRFLTRLFSKEMERNKKQKFYYVV